MKKNFEQDELRSNINIPSVVPDFINERIDNTLRDLEPCKKSRRSVKKTVVMMAACISITSISAVAVFGHDLPIVKSLVQFVNPSAAQNYEIVKTEVSNISENTSTDTKRTVVNKSQTDKGITLTVNDMSYDGATLIVGYSVSKQGGFSSDRDELDATLLPYFHIGKDMSITTLNKASIPIRISSKSANSYLSKQANGEYKGYASLYFGDQDTKIQDNYMLTLIATEIGNVNGQWKIDTGITKKDIYTAAKVTQSSDIHKFENGKIESIKIIRSALNNIINLKGTYDSKTEDMKLSFPGFFILDEKGKCLNYDYLDQRASNGEGPFNSDISIVGLSKDTKTLTVIPYQRISSKEKLYTADITKLPTSIKIQDKEISITNIERGLGKFIMHYTVGGLTDTRRSTYFDFIDKNGNKIDQTKQTPKRTSPLNYETGIGTYELDTEKPEDIVKVICYGFDYKIMDNYKFDVELK